MKKVMNNRLKGFSPILSAALVACCFKCLAVGQSGPNRPKVVDEGQVEVVERQHTFRSASGARSASKASNGVLVVLTDQADAKAANADVAINGATKGKAADGEFRIELPAGRRYSVEVSAGPDYQPFKQTVTLKARAPKFVRAALNSKFGLVKIGPVFPQGAKVLVDGQPVADERMDLDKDSNLLVIDGLTAGEHRITYDHPDYVIVEHNFKITAGSELIWTFTPQLARDELDVSTEAGARVYVDGQPRGDTPGDGKLKIPDILLGKHEVKLVKDGFEEYKGTYTFDFGKPVSLERRLVPLPTSAEFHDDFDFPNASKWSMPATGWKIESGRLRVENAPVLGFAAGVLYRDFAEHFDLKLESAGGAAWAVRIKNPSNYYLFYLSGPKGLIPNRFLTYIVRDNKLDPMKPDDSVPLTVQLVAGQEYEIEITGSGSVIEHKITPAATGKSTPLGAFKDPDNWFPYGGLGFRTVGSEKFSIDDLFVDPR